MRLFKQLTDEEYVEAVRNQLRVKFRWKWLVTFLTIAVTAFAVWFTWDLLAWNMQMAANNPKAWGGFVTGTFVGFLFTSFLAMLTALVFSVRGNGRSDELLIKYHDAIAEVISDSQDIERPEATVPLEKESMNVGEQEGF